MTRSLAPTTILLTVTPLLAGYGSDRWSWLGGPIASLAVWALDHTHSEPAETAAAAAAAAAQSARAPATVTR